MSGRVHKEYDLRFAYFEMHEILFPNLIVCPPRFSQSISHIILSPGWSFVEPVLRIWKTLGRVAFR